MQEQLKFPTRPKIDTSILSNIGEFRDRVTKFNHRWNIDLEYNENARWRPGSYERLKQKVINAIFPHWSQPKGANTIKKLTKFNNYDMRTLRQQMIDIDEDLRVFRQHKISLKGDEAAKEGEELLDNLLDKFFDHPDGVHVSLDPYCYYNKHYRASEDPKFSRVWERPLHPDVYYDESRALGIGPGHLYLSGYPSDHDELVTINKDSDDPRRWFLNILFEVKDINIKCYGGDSINAEVKTELPYGDLAIGMSIPLYDAVMNYRKLLKGTSRYVLSSLNTLHRSCHGYKFPIHKGLEHPFVYSGANNQYNQYGWGNICFGDFEDDLQVALYTGNMAHLKAIIDIWAHSYPLVGTGPLNALHKCHIGMPKDWDDYTKQRINTDTGTCQKVINKGMEKEELIDSYCNTCTLRNSGCSVYNRLTMIPIKVCNSLISQLIEMNVPPFECILLKNMAHKLLNNSHQDLMSDIFGRFNGDYLIHRDYLAEWWDKLRDCIYDSEGVRYAEDLILWHDLTIAIYTNYKITERKYYSDMAGQVDTTLMEQWHIYCYDTDKGTYDVKDIVHAEQVLPIDDMIAAIKHAKVLKGYDSSLITYKEHLSISYPFTSEDNEYRKQLQTEEEGENPNG